MSQSNNKGVLAIFVIVFIFLSLLLIFATYSMMLIKKQSSGLSFDIQSTNGSIAVIEVKGVVMESKPIVEKLEKARKMKSVKAILIRVDSPGGAVGPSQEIFEEIRRIDSDEKNGKPVYASLGSIAASGGYYIAAAARKIYTNPGTLTGSIGVIMQLMDMSKLLDFAKVNPETIKAGKYKDAGQPTRPLTDEEKTIMTGMLKGVHEQFVKHILVLRKEKIKGDIWEYAQGQIFSGQEAKEKGLVDEIAGLWEAGRRIHKELNLPGNFGFQYIKKKKKFDITELLENLDEVVTGLGLKSYFSKVPMMLFGR